ncbi:hypothetical protein NPIL_21191 [Nephila pilipes]|uniref:Uncharacterized protein n=1 Tax=Nephila pilipes TaxID=299642 RepID=A0A8X6TZW7_NEPPI|nr:hypothetical protein NPIL_21191 [Nephila pilipes]
MGTETFDRGAEDSSHICLHATLYAVTRKGNQFISRIIAADETWCHHFDPASKYMRMEWRRLSSVRSKKARSSTRVGKVIFMCFFDVDGPLLLEWLLAGWSTTVGMATGTNYWHDCQC